MKLLFAMFECTYVSVHYVFVTEYMVSVSQSIPLLYQENICSVSWCFSYIGR